MAIYQSRLIDYKEYDKKFLEGRAKAALNQLAWSREGSFKIIGGERFVITSPVKKAFSVLSSKIDKKELRDNDIQFVKRNISRLKNMKILDIRFRDTQVSNDNYHYQVIVEISYKD